MFSPTAEQEQAKDAYLTGQSLRIEALAGSGKTTTLRMLVGAGSPRGGKILYTSFGKKVIADAKGSFPKTCRVATNHGLAWGVGRQYELAGRLQGRITPHDLCSHFGWTERDFSPYCDSRSGAYGVIETLNTFCQSADERVKLIHAVGPAMRTCRGDKEKARVFVRVLAEKALELWQEMMNRYSRIPVTHDVYLKQWALGQPVLSYSTILLDEAQDANPVIVSVLQQQEHAQLVIVGDRRQAIYSWRGAINAMDEFAIAHSTNLTQSFRFGPEIAEVANAILTDQCDSDVLLRGDDNQPGRVGTCQAPHCYLSRTNASLVGELFEIEQRTPGYRVGVVGGVDDLVKLVDGAELLQMGQPSVHPELAEFSDWKLVEEAVEHDAYQHLRKLVGLVGRFGTANLRNGLERIRRNEMEPEKCDVLLSTAHKAKGAEFESVRLLDDFTPKGPPGDVGLYGWKPEDGNLLYVAATRARKHLDITQCEAVLGSLPLGYEFTPVDAIDDGASAENLFPGEFPVDVVAEPRPRLLEGRWDHPIIEGGLIDVVEEPEGMLVTVTALGFELFQSYGLVDVQEASQDHVTITVGSARLQVPKEALTLTPA